MRYALALLLSLCLIRSALAGVTVHVSPASVKYRVFDPAKPPSDMPHLKGDESAVTVCGFEFSAEPNYAVSSRERQPDGTWTAQILVTGVGVSVRQSIVIWIPKGASGKLKAHEEGHRKLDEMMYKQLGETAAHSAGIRMDGNRFTGDGPSAYAAVNQAVRNMFEQAGRAYLAQTESPNNEINSSYDTITAHGANDVPEADAIRRAIEGYEQNHATSQPAPDIRRDPP